MVEADSSAPYLVVSMSSIQLAGSETEADPVTNAWFLLSTIMSLFSNCSGSRFVIFVMPVYILAGAALYAQIIPRLCHHIHFLWPKTNLSVSGCTLRVRCSHPNQVEGQHEGVIKQVRHAHFYTLTTRNYCLPGVWCLPVNGMKPQTGFSYTYVIPNVEHNF